MPCQNSHNCSELVFCACQAALRYSLIKPWTTCLYDPGGHIDRLAALVHRRSLFPRLVQPMLVVVPRVLGQDPPEVPFAVDQQVVEAFAA